ncbi:olfactory receptor 14I1 [Ctenodactylus gundi]
MGQKGGQNPAWMKVGPGGGARAHLWEVLGGFRGTRALACPVSLRQRLLPSPSPVWAPAPCSAFAPLSLGLGNVTERHSPQASAASRNVILPSSPAPATPRSLPRPRSLAPTHAAVCVNIQHGLFSYICFMNHFRAQREHCPALVGRCLKSAGTAQSGKRAWADREAFRAGRRNQAPRRAVEMPAKMDDPGLWHLRSLPAGCPSPGQRNNVTEVTEFLLTGFSETWELQALHAGLFLLVYLAALAGNLLIMLVVTLDRHLHTPMYFFLSNLSFLDLCYISVTVPKSIHGSLTRSTSISYSSCVAQVYFFFAFASAELAFLTVMSYDRYIAICQPLRYAAMMTSGKCHQMAVTTWLSCFSYAAVHTGNMFWEPISSSNVIHQFFCDIPHVLALVSCEVFFVEFVTLALSSCLVLGCFVLMIVSYVQIFSTLLRIPSVENRTKAFATCSPQLIVIVLFLTSGLFAALGPIAKTSSLKELVTALAYTVLPPLLNPLIYSLRNKEIKTALWRLFRKPRALQQ